MIDEIEANERFQLNLYRNKVLLTGDASVVEKFYKEDYGKLFSGSTTGKYDMSSHKGTFWYNVGPKNARVLFGITKMINDAFVRLVTSGGFDVTVMNEKDEEDKTQTQRLNDILEFNNFKDSKWGKAESMQSGLGYTAFKPAIDTEIADMPIIEVVSSENIEIISKRDFITGYRFKTTKQVDKVLYEIQEIWRLDELDRVIIEYRVVNVNSGQDVLFNELDLDLKTRLGLADLEDAQVTDFSNLNEIPVVLKNNTAYNSFFPNAPFGEADTQGMDMIEDALSELISAMVEEVRKGRIKVLIAEELVPSNKDGMKQAFDDFKLDYEIMNKHEASGDKLIEVIQGEINSEKYLQGIGAMIMYACNKANLHPMTVGITGVESIAASQESQVEREKVSMRTREMKLNSWREALVKVFENLLKVDDIMKNKTPQDYNINIQFGQFTNPNRESVIDLLGKAVTSGVISIQEAQKEYYGDNMGAEEIFANYIKTKVEKGIALTASERQYYENISQEETGIDSPPETIVETVDEE